MEQEILAIKWSIEHFFLYYDGKNQKTRRRYTPTYLNIASNQALQTCQMTLCDFDTNFEYFYENNITSAIFSLEKFFHALKNLKRSKEKYMQQNTIYSTKKKRAHDDAQNSKNKIEVFTLKKEIFITPLKTLNILNIHKHIIVVTRLRFSLKNIMDHRKKYILGRLLT